MKLPEILIGTGIWKKYSLGRPAGGLLLPFRLKSRGEANAILFETIENPVYLNQLPPECKEFRLLHLTDLHLGNYSALMPALTQALAGLEDDLCVLTGDYGIGYSSSPVLDVEMQHLKQLIDTEIFTVLGNHDSIFMVPLMENLVSGCC